jgi:hypothetical protein
MDFSSPQWSKLMFKKTERIDNDEVCLDADMIRVLIAIDESKNLDQVGREVGMSVTDFQETLSQLIKLNLIEPIGKDVAYLDESFIQEMQATLSQAVGPMAEILISEAAAGMNLSVSQIPKMQVAELINALSMEIPDEESKIHFKKAMIHLIKSKLE